MAEILLIDDEITAYESIENYFILLKDKINISFDIKFVDNYSDAVLHINKGIYPLVLIDLKLPNPKINMRISILLSAGISTV